MRDWRFDTMACFLGPLHPYMEDPRVSEILVNGPDAILVERGGCLEAVPERFDSIESLEAAIHHVAQLSDAPLVPGQLIVEGKLPDGSRVEAVLPPAARQGPYLSIRRFRQQGLGMAELVELGSISPSMCALLERACTERQNILVAGGTGTGKTSLLNALASFFGAEERVICIEDTPELALACGHQVKLRACAPRGPDEPGATIRDLFRASLRLRPDRIVIGEIRGAEALELLQAMTSGHGGCLSTIHASHPGDALRRLETLALMSDVELPLFALQRQVASAVDLVVQLERLADGRRRVSSLSRLVTVSETGRYELENLEAPGE